MDGSIDNRNDFALHHSRSMLLVEESVGDISKEEQHQHNELVLRSVHAAAQRVGNLPELVLVADEGGGILLSH